MLATTMLNKMAADLDEWPTPSGSLHKMGVGSAGHDDQVTVSN